jgi:hypothetical protein
MEGFHKFIHILHYINLTHCHVQQLVKHQSISVSANVNMAPDIVKRCQLSAKDEGFIFYSSVHQFSKTTDATPKGSSIPLLKTKMTNSQQRL